MVWFYVDDSFESHPKVRSIPRSKRLRAVGLWTLAGNWSARHLTDGLIPATMIEDWGATSSDVDALVSATLWDVDGDNFRFHDWSDWAKTREEVLAKRAVRQAAGRSGGVKSGNARRSKAEANASQDLEQIEATRLTHGEPPSHPYPSHPKDGARKRAKQLPDDWQPNEQHENFARSSRLVLSTEVAQFRDHHAAKGSTMKDWDAAFRTWLRNAVRFGGTTATPQQRASVHQLEEPPDGLSPDQYAAWERQQRERRAQ